MRIARPGDRPTRRPNLRLTNSSRVAMNKGGDWDPGTHRPNRSDTDDGTRPAGVGMGRLGMAQGRTALWAAQKWTTCATLSGGGASRAAERRSAALDAPYPAAQAGGRGSRSAPL